MTIPIFSLAFLAACSAGWVVDAMPTERSTFVPVRRADANQTTSNRCVPPSIPMKFLGGVAANDTGLVDAGKALQSLLTSFGSEKGVDSLAVAVVTPSEVIFQNFAGTLRANETALGGPDADSLYRIASISKMFAALEMMVLRGKGQLNLDDPVTRFLPNFTYPGGSWAAHLGLEGAQDADTEFGPITLRQLASHMSGIGRDYPPTVLPGYPNIDFNALQQRVAPTPAEVLQSIATLPLVADPYTYPIYSNVGYALLGYSLVAAANKTSYAELLQSDVFGPLGLSSSFGVTQANAGKIVVGSIPAEADADFEEGMNAAGGQYSSLRDLITVMQTFLDPSGNPKSLLPAYAMREWTRPLHGWDDGLTETGAPWEINKIPDAHGVPRRFYSKSGDLASYHSTFAFDPTHASYGVIVLMASNSSLAEPLGEQVIKIFQPAFDTIIDLSVAQQYQGQWESDDGKSVATTYASNGSVYINHLVLNGTDIFGLVAQLGGSTPPADLAFGLWSTGRREEFRVALGLPVMAAGGPETCFSGWAGFDPYYGQGAPVDLVLFENSSAGERVMRIPSSGSILKRKSA